MRRSCLAQPLPAAAWSPGDWRAGQVKKQPARPQDPHFKATNHRRRIISAQLLAEYAFLLAPGGRLYTATDVQEVRRARARARMRPLVLCGRVWCRRRQAAADACAACLAMSYRAVCLASQLGLSSSSVTTQCIPAWPWTAHKSNLMAS